jgi:hypothetical protein
MTKTGAENDRESDAVRRNRHRVDVAAARPAQCVTQPPTVFLEWRQRAPHLFLRTGADGAAPGKGQPVASPESDHAGDGHEQRARQDRTCADDEQSLSASVNCAPWTAC